jgi:hypothetical protein
MSGADECSAKPPKGIDFDKGESWGRSPAVDAIGAIVVLLAWQAGDTLVRGALLPLACHEVTKHANRFRCMYTSSCKLQTTNFGTKHRLGTSSDSSLLDATPRAIPHDYK